MAARTRLGAAQKLFWNWSVHREADDRAPALPLEYAVRREGESGAARLHREQREQCRPRRLRRRVWEVHQLVDRGDGRARRLAKGDNRRRRSPHVELHLDALERSRVEVIARPLLHVEDRHREPPPHVVVG
eukprot:3566554-Pleurochrysis_carterae.AAC.3